MKVAIKGVYQTRFGELWDKSWEDLMMEATTGALSDAGVEKEKIECVYVGSMLPSWVMGQSHLGAVVSEVLGVCCPVVSVEAACASGGVAVREALLAVDEGRYKNVLVVGVEKMSDVEAAKVAEALMGGAGQEERESGVSFPGLYALMARAYMEEYGLERQDLAEVSVKSHFHGSLNDLAQFRFEVSREQVMEAAMVADPLGLLDCSGVSDGAAAVVVGKGTKGVVAVGTGMAMDSVSLVKRKSLVGIEATKKAMAIATDAAGLGVGEIGVAEVHDCFSIAEVMALEDLGFAKKGRGVELYKSGKVRLGGGCPVNTSGGLKACGHPVGATGVKQVVEVVRQLRGGLGERQVKGVKVGLTHNVGGTGGSVVVSLFTV